MSTSSDPIHSSTSHEGRSHDGRCSISSMASLVENNKAVFPA
eukprot:CAMPEP_0185707622 /NCGR_PEP_ID=MMETSP1164-20130828/24754_1 /TAXON_ID=1104430 /ORGANISM="Chrysoreinhardia sp, Strain CCMP2950" /LENGTH=41 /DNA_ID= /DNA_START= /DNA_END= /DNA_ORIENTATION=